MSFTAVETAGGSRPRIRCSGPFGHRPRQAKTAWPLALWSEPRAANWAAHDVMAGPLLRRLGWNRYQRNSSKRSCRSSCGAEMRLSRRRVFRGTPAAARSPGCAFGDGCARPGCGLDLPGTEGSGGAGTPGNRGLVFGCAGQSALRQLTSWSWRLCPFGQWGLKSRQVSHLRHNSGET